jgi:hypothetical protein
MRRVLFNFAVVASLPAFVLLAVAWLRSGRYTDSVTAERFHGYEVTSSDGSLYLIVHQQQFSVPGRTPTPIAISDRWLFHREATEKPSISFVAFLPDGSGAPFAAGHDVGLMSTTTGVMRFDVGVSFVKFPIWIPLLLSAALPAAWLIRRRTGYRWHLGLCPRCGYDLRATPDRCPECGFSAPRIGQA